METRRALRCGSLLIVSVAVACITGCSIIPQFIRGTEIPAEEAADVSSHGKVLPKVYLIPDQLKSGERVIGVVVANEIDKGYDAGVNKKGKEVTYTLWQRVLRGMMGWGIVTIVLFLILAFVFPSGFAAILAMLKRRWKKVAVETAQGLEAAEIKEKFPTVTAKLEETQSDKTKTVIKDLREKGKL